MSHVSLITAVSVNPHRAAGETLRCTHNLAAFIGRAAADRSAMLAEAQHGNVKLPNMPTVTVSDAGEAEMIEAASFALARKVSTLMRLLNRTVEFDDKGRVARELPGASARIRSEIERTATEMRTLYSELRTLAPEATAQWDDRSGEAHMTGEERAIRNNKGTHHTDSCLGDAADMRHNENYDASDNRAHVYALGMVHSIAERDLADITGEPLV